MILDPQVGDVVSLAPGMFHKHLEKDKQYVITAVKVTRFSYNAQVSLATVATVINQYGNRKHLGSWSGIYLHQLQRHDFLTAAYGKKKRSAA